MLSPWVEFELRIFAVSFLMGENLGRNVVCLLASTQVSALLFMNSACGTCLQGWLLCHDITWCWLCMKHQFLPLLVKVMRCYCWILILKIIIQIKYWYQHARRYNVREGFERVPKNERLQQPAGLQHLSFLETIYSVPLIWSACKLSADLL